MGRGDKRTAKGKRFKGTFGVSRPRNAKKKGTKKKKTVTIPNKKPTPRKTAG
ncbi:MAG: 30S ribosomal protein THX [Gemmatimonadetes bacterium]|nr:30S ribosomal protein THX [Gemmatimonadota bacterium]